MFATSTTTATSIRMTPEQQKAFIVLENCLPYECSLAFRESHIEQMFPTNYTAFSPVPFTRNTLPKDKDWLWNQSSAKITVALNALESATFQKMNPRKRNICQVAPSYKIWLFVIEHQWRPVRYFIWCEKGLRSFRSFSMVQFPAETSQNHSQRKTKSSIQNVRSIVKPDIQLQELAFLKPFMDHETAAALGW
jgi:hypothetical protein